jgi:Methyltransferase domain
MQQLLRRISHKIERQTLGPKWRRTRMRDMLERLRVPPHARVIDLGGSEFNWKLIDHDCHVTLVNLPGFNPPSSDPGRFTRIEADACHLTNIFEDMSFDVAFSNSTIEHVGDESRQELFAREVQRLAPAYWVQTPSSRFPIEIHTAVPLYWSLPMSMRESMLARWEEKMPVWTQMIRETRILSRRRMETLFPGAQVYIERKFGIEKSYSFYRPHPGESLVAQS